MSSENIFEVALSVYSGLGPRQVRGLLQSYGSAELVFQAGKRSLLRIQGLGPARINRLLQPEALRMAELAVKNCKKEGIQILSINHVRYPNRLKECIDAPIVLFEKGQSPLNNARVLAVVGTRSATPNGQRITEQFVAQISGKHPVLIVSGLAYGIDGAAHRQAVQSGIPTVGVLAHGLDKIYPAEHHRLAMRMLDNGSLISEFPPYTKLIKENFPRRNRIIAGLADAVLVVEASKSGGALITAEMALAYHREVFAVPGRVNDPYSEGCLELIRQNKAGLVHRPSDLVEAMNWDQLNEPVKQLTIQFRRPLNETELQIRTLLCSGVNLIDNLSRALSLDNSKLAAVLLQMELEGLINSLPGARIRWLGPTE